MSTFIEIDDIMSTACSLERDRIVSFIRRERNKWYDNGQTEPDIQWCILNDIANMIEDCEHQED